MAANIASKTKKLHQIDAEPHKEFNQYIYIEIKSTIKKILTKKRHKSFFQN